MSLFGLCRHSLKFRVLFVHLWLPSQNLRLPQGNRQWLYSWQRNMTVVHAENLSHHAIVQCIVCWEVQEFCA